MDWPSRFFTRSEDGRMANHRRRGLLLVWYLTVFGLAAAASTNVVRAAEQPAPAQISGMPTPEYEAQRAAREHAGLLAGYGGAYVDPKLAAYVDEIGDRL